MRNGTLSSLFVSLMFHPAPLVLCPLTVGIIYSFRNTTSPPRGTWTLPHIWENFEKYRLEYSAKVVSPVGRRFEGKLGFHFTFVSGETAPLPTCPGATLWACRGVDGRSEAGKPETIRPKPIVVPSTCNRSLGEQAGRSTAAC